jgi:hypothetical protein
MQKSTTFTTIFRVKKCYFHYDFAYKKVSFSLRYAKNVPRDRLYYSVVEYISDRWKTRMQESKVRKLFVNVSCKDVFSRGSGYNEMSTKNMMKNLN